jgi:hypothetical protein
LEAFKKKLLSILLESLQDASGVEAIKASILLRRKLVSFKYNNDFHKTISYITVSHPF